MTYNEQYAAYLRAKQRVMLNEVECCKLDPSYIDESARRKQIITYKKLANEYAKQAEIAEARP